MERDYAETLSRLRGIREQLIDPRISAYGGHVVKTAGDGMLVEFGSADAAFEALGSKRGDFAQRPRARGQQTTSAADYWITRSRSVI
jgi:adenylate cyclase